MAKPAAPAPLSAALDFSGKQALVVGGSSGIGNAVAQAFRQCGAAAHVTGTRASAADYGLQDFSDMTGLGYSRLDVTVPGALASFDPPIERLEALVLCHALARFHGEEFDPQVFRAVVDANLSTMFDAAEQFEPILAESGGAIVIVSSLAAFRTIPYQPAYTA